MNTEFLKKQFSMSSFFALLFGVTGWLVAITLAFYFIGWMFTPAQLCGYYLDHSFNYKVRAYWRYSYDTTVYNTFNGKEAIDVLKQLNEQLSPLIQQQRSKEL
jgi:hypothetical protein